MRDLDDERGFALIMTVFIVALATIIVMDFSSEALAYQRATRTATERIQADFMIKSSLNLARVLLEIPKEPGVQEDWLGEPWALIAAAPSLPISGFIGEPRLMIVDESGKININAVDSAAGIGNPFGAQPPPAGGAPGILPIDTYWKNVLLEMFLATGFVREQHDADEKRTLGNLSFEARDQVAVIHDWIDRDNQSYNSAAFPGQGIESGAERTWFYNRALRTLAELALVPGMTLERVSRIAPFVTVGTASNARVNVNTAPIEVLLALGFPENQAIDIVQSRISVPINASQLQTLTTGDAQLSRVTSVRSSEFSVYAQVRMPNVTRWAKAYVTVQGGLGQRRAVIRSIEYL